MWERHMDRSPPVHIPTGDQTCNLDMCPDWELKPQTLGLWEEAPAIWATPARVNSALPNIIMEIEKQ